jgi:hypothetical protein
MPQESVKNKGEIAQYHGHEPALYPDQVFTRLEVSALSAVTPDGVYGADGGNGSGRSQHDCPYRKYERSLCEMAWSRRGVFA